MRRNRGPVCCNLSLSYYVLHDLCVCGAKWHTTKSQNESRREHSLASVGKSTWYGIGAHICSRALMQNLEGLCNYLRTIIWAQEYGQLEIIHHLRLLWEQEYGQLGTIHHLRLLLSCYEQLGIIHHLRLQLKQLLAPFAILQQHGTRQVSWFCKYAWCLDM